MGETNKPKKRNYPKVRKSSIKAPKLTFDNVSKALEDSAGILDVAAKRLKISRAWLHEYIHRDPELVKVRINEKECFIDSAEAQLVQKVQRGEDWAVKYTLSTLGRKRGYQEKQQVEHSGNMSLKIGPLNETEKEDLLDDLKIVEVEPVE